MTISDERTKRGTRGVRKAMDNAGLHMAWELSEAVARAVLEVDAPEIASAELRGRVEGLKDAKAIAEMQRDHDTDWATKYPDESYRMDQRAYRARTIAAFISARLASLHPEVAKREEGV